MSTRLQYDSNLFALPDGVSPPDGRSRSAWTWRTDLGLRLDKSYGLQRFILDANVNRLHYSPYDDLDFTGRALAASWLWSLTPSISGLLLFNQREEPNSFADTGFRLSSNARHIEERRFDVDWKPGAALHPRFSIQQYEDRSDQLVFQRESSKTTSIEAALIYEFASGNNAALYGRRGKGTYFETSSLTTLQTDAKFKETEAGVRAYANFNDVSRLEGNLGWLDRTHDAFPIRDFSGVVGRLSYRYQLTGKTELLAAVARSLTAAQTTFSSYSHDESFTFVPTWNVTSKVAVKPSWSYLRRTYRGALVPVDNDLRETTRTAALQLEWSPLRWVELSTAFARVSRVSTIPGLQYIDRSVFVSGKLKF